jgi:hypothetical protein
MLHVETCSYRNSPRIVSCLIFKRRIVMRRWEDEEAGRNIEEAGRNIEEAGLRGTRRV